MTTNRLEKTATALVTLAAVVVAAAVGRREFFPSVAGVTAAASVAPRQVDEWRAVAALGRRTGRPDAPVTVVEFADFECPFCKRFHEDALKPVLRAMADSIAFVFVHFPLPGHRFAAPAAKAAECAADQGRFSEFADALYARQDSLGLKTWDSFATDARVADLKAFRDCVAGSESPRVDSGLTVGKRIGVAGTPTVLVNGWLAPMPPTDSALRAAIAKALRD